jgi:solute carrier family 27 fatty acid transporter 1/4
MISKIIFYICEFFRALVRDLIGAKKLFTIKLKIRQFEKSNSTIPEKFIKFVNKHPNKACIIFDDQIWTFQQVKMFFNNLKKNFPLMYQIVNKQVEDYSNKIARLFSEKFNLKKGDCVALFMENKPEYIGIWLGLSKLGVITALINTNLRTHSLKHVKNVFYLYKVFNNFDC